MPDFATKTQEKTDRELLEMIYQFDQWSPAMLAAVEAELSNRKILPEDFSARRRQIIDTEELAMKKRKRSKSCRSGDWMAYGFRLVWNRYWVHLCIFKSNKSA